MYYSKLPSAVASKITVTVGAKSIYELINTAASTSLGKAIIPSETNAIDITVENGDIRYLCDGNVPTAANGILLPSGTKHYLRGIPLDNLQLIRVGGSDVTCSIAVGHSEISESSSSTAYGITATLSTGDIEIGAVELKDADTDNRANMKAANTGRTTGTIVVATQNIDGAGNVLTATASSASSDGVSNPTMGGFKSFLKAFNGTTWDRLRSGLTTVSGTLTGLLNVLPWSIYKASPTVRTDGQGGPLLTTPSGDLNVNLNTQLQAAQDSVSARGLVPLNNKTTALAASLIVNAAGSTAVEVRWTNTLAAAQYGQVHNTTTLPADGVTPVAIWVMPASSSGSWTPTSELALSTGFTVCNSSTAATKTIGAADCWISGDYR